MTILSKFENLGFDFSRSFYKGEVLNELEIDSCLVQGFESLFKGLKINQSEDRSVLHFQTRDFTNNFSGNDVVRSQQQAFFTFVDEFYSSQSRFKHIENIISVGIGGSHLGSEFLVQALGISYNPKYQVKFLSNLDPENFLEVTRDLLPKHTLVIFISKTFTTIETLSNFKLIEEWFQDNILLWENSVAVTNNVDLAQEMGFKLENILEFDLNIGGRFSISSPVGLPVALAYGLDAFKEVLNGMHKVDEMVRNRSNGWEVFKRHVYEYLYIRNVLKIDTMAILPYSQGFARFPAYLQQLFMESLGKSVTRTGQTTSEVGLVIFGEIGTGSQHSFMQFFHQGAKSIASEFILLKPKRDNFYDQRKDLFLNGLAQADALMVGNSNISAKVKSPHQMIAGGKSSTIIVLEDTSAFTLGLNLSWYENLVAAISFAWDINAFDQWGVELGKTLAKTMSISEADIQRESTKQLLKELDLY